jgi:PAS domain S-box-containing protein
VPDTTMKNDSENKVISEARKTKQELLSEVAEARSRIAQLEAAERGAASAYSRRLIEASLDPLVTIAPDGKITDLNSATEKTTGRPREELIGTDFSDCFTEPDQAQAGYEQAFREGQVTNYPLKILHRDGHTTPVLYNASVYRDDAGTVVGVFAAARDITEQRQLQEGLRRMSQVFTHSDDSIIILDLEGIILDANEAAEHNYGRTLEELRGQSATMIVPPESRQQLDELMSQVNQGKIVRDVESFRSDNAGHLIPVVLTLLPLTDEAGSLMGVVGVAKKVADLKRAEQQLRRYASQLDAANQELEAFSYSVAHDLRAPLRAMDGFSQALLEDYHERLDEHGQDYLGRIRAASQRMAELIDDLLALSRVGRSPFEHKEVDLSAMAGALASELRSAGLPRATDIAISPGLVVNGDERLLRIALTKLLENAWKFTANQPHATIELGVEEHEGQAAYFVRDDGVGFDMAHAGQLFVPFQRLHSRAEFAGNGIGLSIAARIIARHGGRIWAEGAEGQGATFHFTLPGHE